MGLIALAAPADAQKRGGTLTIVRPTDPVSLDPHTETTAPGAWVYYNILEPLIYLDEKMTIQPRLATSYEVMSPTKVRFKLRPNVKFHDGTPFNAAAVKFTFERAFKSTPPARWASLAGPIAGAEVVDDLTVDIVTKEPYGPILRSMAMLYVSIVSPTAVQKLGEGALRAPVGTGPFKFVEWKTNTQIVIERNPDYWGEKALLDRVIFKVVPEEGARMIAVQTGDADMVMFPSPAQLPTFKKDSEVHRARGGRPPGRLHRLQHQARAARRRPRPPGPPAVGGPQGDPRQHRRGSGRAREVLPLARACSATRTCSSTRLFPFDRAKAKALLAQAGWTPGPDGILQKGGQKLTLNWIAQRGRYPKDGEITEAVQQMWKEIGVDAKVEFREWATVFNESRKADWGRHNWTFGWATTNADADYSLFAQYHSSQLVPTGWNRNGYENPKVDQLLEAARRSLNQSEREKLYGEVQDILAKDTLWIPVYNTKEIVITRSNVKGYVIHPVEYNLGLWKTWIDK